MPLDVSERQRWYSGITRYQWLVLLIASLGWIFDVFEGQIFVASMNEAMPSLVEKGTSSGAVRYYNNIALGAFLLGGALGGVVFGMLSDMLGRKRTMQLTIVMYSVFTCVSALSMEWWHLVVFRFLVAMGVGGEWAVASALVAEVFPRRARARSLGIFHASSVLGTYLAVLAGVFIIGNESLGSTEFRWRLGFALGALPALLIIWIRRSVEEPESWQQARDKAQSSQNQKLGSLSDLFRGALLRRTLVGTTLAAVGLATFWGVHIYGKDLLRGAADRESAAQAAEGTAAISAIDEQTNPPAEAQQKASVARAAMLKRWEMLGMFLVTTGGGLGLLSFGPISEALGRRLAFLLFHLGGLLSALALFQFESRLNSSSLLVALPIFGFLTLGMHAGYAVYFPELFPTRLRGTGAGFCFNFGRIIAAPILVLTGWMQRDVQSGGLGWSLNESASALSLLFLLGMFVLLFAPETRGEELPE